ncbi:MAG TPA: DUF134 domain-containing protein [candidate division Zixibacteria bacterium]|nr:DUF134 domain-containing protein [candidate division Zixibacteria bacterium]
MRYYRSRKGRGGGQGRHGMNNQVMRGRPLKEILIEDIPRVQEIIAKPLLSEEVIILFLAEYEALRLVDLEGLNQDLAGSAMGVSRGTIWRLLDSGRTKLMKVLVEGKKIIIENTSQFVEKQE